MPCSDRPPVVGSTESTDANRVEDQLADLTRAVIDAADDMRALVDDDGESGYSMSASQLHVSSQAALLRATALALLHYLEAVR